MNYVSGCRRTRNVSAGRTVDAIFLGEAPFNHARPRGKIIRSSLSRVEKDNDELRTTAVKEPTLQPEGREEL